MRVFRNLESVTIGPSACAIGMFDGVHIGHKMVLEQAIRESKINGLESVVFTFANHPQSLISQTPTPLLSTTEERIEAFEQFGFDAVLLLDFTPEIQNMDAESFVNHILVGCLHVKAVSIGYDHRFGKNRQGDGQYLKAQGLHLGFDVEIIDPVKVEGQIVSSTVIRKLLSFGDLEKANQYLGRPYALSGKVVSGVGRGRTIGFPTANLELPPERLIPANGVYAGLVRIDDEAIERPAVCNIGLAPTFADQEEHRMEVHLLDYNGELYGKRLRFTFLKHIRSEQRFPSVNELINQIQKDCDEAKTVIPQLKGNF